MLTIAAESTLTAEARDLIAGSEAVLRSVYPPEACFSFSPEELMKAGSTFLVARMAEAGDARSAGTAVGCAALVSCDGYGEIKRLFVEPAWRGHGIGRALMARIESEAAGQGLPMVRLETGARLAAAVRLYETLGYQECGRFGDYTGHPSSLFMEKRLA
ncbi:MAG: GNAT family N-acetyltransferase [Paracoccaceae bacterium]|nr:GNAT family N-acetyltransferase [Paracoccaceae bacterium]